MEENTTTLVVIPSIRPVNSEYLEALKGFDIFIADDSDGKIDRTYITRKDYIRDGFKKIILGDREFFEEYVPKKYWRLFPRHCPSIKNIGLYYAWKEGYKQVILIDDDVDTRGTRPEEFDTICKPLSARELTVPYNWFNTLWLLTSDREIYARGYPYEYRTTYLREFEEIEVQVCPRFNEGLWMGTPDINGIDKMMLDRSYVHRYLDGNTSDEDTPWHISATVYDGPVVIPKGCNLPLSIMNCQIDVSLIPAFYQPPDYPIYGDFIIRRHDDIWSMYFLKKIMDGMGADVTVGGPILHHRKSGDAIRETINEHYTNMIQRIFTDVVDDSVRVSPGIDGNVIREAMILASQCICNASDLHNSLWRKILIDHFTKVEDWAKMFMVLR